MIGSSSNQQLSKLTGYDSKFAKNVNNISVVQSNGFEKPSGFSASNGYLTQMHSPSKKVKT
jgi:hypothetical protein